MKSERAVSATGSLLQVLTEPNICLVRKAPQPPHCPKRDQGECAAVSLSKLCSCNRLCCQASPSERGCCSQTSLPAGIIQLSVIARTSHIYTTLTPSVSLMHPKNYKLDAYLITSTNALTMDLSKGSRFCFILSSPGAMGP